MRLYHRSIRVLRAWAGCAAAWIRSWLARSSAGFRPVLIVVAALVAFSARDRASAHPAYLTGAVAKIGKDGEVRLALTFDIVAFALNDLPDRISDADMNALLDGPRAELDDDMADARRRFVAHFEILADGRSVAIDRLVFPSTGEVLRAAAVHDRPRLPVLATCEVTAVLPPLAKFVAFQFPDAIGPVVLTVERSAVEPFSEPVAPGLQSTPLPVAVLSQAAVGTERGDRRMALGRRLLAYVELGFTHILPYGLDHILFVLGLCLLAGRLSALLWQVTAFTVAHSLTLGLAAVGLIRMPSPVIEPLITASIVLVAIDNLRAAELRWWRIVVVFGFGLVHGMGFAGALRDLALAPHDLLLALVGFNVGVELGQLTVVALVLAAIGWFRASQRYRRVIVVPASAVIAVVAFVWTVQRLGLIPAL